MQLQLERTITQPYSTHGILWSRRRKNISMCIIISLEKIRWNLKLLMFTVCQLIGCEQIWWRRICRSQHSGDMWSIHIIMSRRIIPWMVFIFRHDEFEEVEFSIFMWWVSPDNFLLLCVSVTSSTGGVTSFIRWLSSRWSDDMAVRDSLAASRG